MHLRNCPICNAPPSNTDLIGPLVANHHKQEGREFQLTYCACGDLIYLSPAPDESDIRAMYADSHQFDRDETYRAEEFAVAADDFYSGRLRALLSKMNLREGQALRVLEVGAGLSWMCRAAKKFNPQNVTVAQDISSEVVRECTWVDYYYVADLMNCSEIEAQAPFDIISLTHVIEHLVDPVGALKRLRKVIAPGGLVFITAPHHPSGWKRGNDIETWRDWSYNHVPAHIQYFSRRSLGRAARGAGLELSYWDGEPEDEQAFEAWLQASRPVVSMISPAVREQISRYRDEFSNARPFRHVIIDYFFDSDKAQRLLDEFPPFDPANAKNEFGEIGRKAVVTDIQRISPFYAEVYEYIASKGFLDLVSQITGIPDLVHDELMFGGGTHENLEGQELDPHVDFNFLEDRKIHRRLNLLLYLNKEWEQDWGGCLELHSNPRRPQENRIDVILPLFNRCVVFETSEHSWHGFERIRLPEGKKLLSRKLLSIYLYTRERPAEEIVPPHATFYVQRPLPARLAPGHTLTADDVLEAEHLVRGRDGWIEHYQKKEIEDSRRLQQLTSLVESFRRILEDATYSAVRAGAGTDERELVMLLKEIRVLKDTADSQESEPPPLQVPLAGCGRQEGRSLGIWSDGWIGSPFEVGVRLEEPIDLIVIEGYLPEQPPQEMELTIYVNGVAALRHRPAEGPFSLRVRGQICSGELVKVRIASNVSCMAGSAADTRELVMVLREIRLLKERIDLHQGNSQVRGWPARLRRFVRHRILRSG